MTLHNAKRTLYFLIITIGAIACNDGGSAEASKEGDATAIIVDSTRNVELIVPDSVKDIDLENAKDAISEYFDEADRFNLDTISTLSPAALALKAKAQDLRKKLITVLPRISL